MSPPTRTALVTGAAGFIGSALVRALRMSDLRVVALDAHPCLEDDVDDVIVGDLTSPDVLEDAFRREPAVVFHLAARTSVLESTKDPVGSYEVNVAATQRILECARQAGTRQMVMASTNAVVGATDEIISETTPLRPLTPYGATKAAAEMLCSAYSSAYDMAVAAVRLTNVYGPGMLGKDTFVIRLLRAAAESRPVTIYGDGLQERDYLYVDDALKAFLLAWRCEVSGPLTVGTERSTSVLDLCELAGQVTGHPLETNHVAAPPGEMRAVRVDTSQARSLGFRATTDLRDGLAATWTRVSSPRVPVA
jgi:UDP-glucose 4-epimerase